MSKISAATAVLAALTTSSLAFADEASSFQNVKCEGAYKHHLQGICTNGKDAVYWCFTTSLVKTDRNGKVEKKVAVANHHGDLCYRDGSVYVAVNLGKFNDPQGNADSWVYVYDAGDLTEIDRHKTAEVFHGAGGIGWDGRRFVVVGGLPEAVEENYAYEYDERFRFVKRHVIASGHTHLGIQTATFGDGLWWFGCYGKPKILLKTNASFKMEGRFEFDCSLGIVDSGGKGFLVARGPCRKESGCVGELLLADADANSGLALRTSPAK